MAWLKNRIGERQGIIIGQAVPHLNNRGRQARNKGRQYLPHRCLTEPHVPRKGKKMRGPNRVNVMLFALRACQAHRQLEILSVCCAQRKPRAGGKKMLKRREPEATTTSNQQREMFSVDARDAR